MKKYIFLYILLFSFVYTNVYSNDSNDDMYSEYQDSNYKANNQNKSKKIYFPRLEGRILAEYYIDNLRDKEDRIKHNDKATNNYLSLKSYLKLRITEGFYAETDWYLRPVNKRIYTDKNYAKNLQYNITDSYGDDFYGKQDYIQRRFHYKDYGLGIETLKLGYTGTNIALNAGKFNPTFAIGYNKYRFSGIYGTILPSEYELTEKLGGNISALLPFGNITFNLFTDDTTDLSTTMFKRAGKDKSKGGAGNTKRLNNYSITFNVKLDNLTFNFGYRKLNDDHKYDFNNKDVNTGENGWTGALEYKITLDYDITIKPFIEYTYLENYDGMLERDVQYLTTFLPIMFENWHLIFSNTYKFDIEKYHKKYNSYLSQISFGYKFDFGLMLDFARVWWTEYKKADGFLTLKEREKFKMRKDAYVFMISYVYDF